MAELPRTAILRDLSLLEQCLSVSVQELFHVRMLRHSHRNLWLNRDIGMLTGDHQSTAFAIAKTVGIIGNDRPSGAVVVRISH